MWGKRQKRSDDVSSIGWRPDRGDIPEGYGAGPYFHGSHHGGDEAGLSAGIGLYHDNNIDFVSANAQLGVFGDEGSRRFGLGGDAQVLRFDSGDLGGWGLDGSAVSAGAEFSIGEDGLTAGASAEWGQVGATVGNLTPSEENEWDTSLRVGGSAGVGFAGRLHWGDSDGDGIREMGLGVDFLAGSFDLKSEALGQAWNGISGAAESAWDWITGDGDGD